MNGHLIRWQAPQPMWARFGANAQAALSAPDQFRPAILGFARDDFMEQLIGTLGRDPAQIGTMLAQPETWRTPRKPDVDLVERVTLPRVAQRAVRGVAALRPKSVIDPVQQTRTVKESTLERELPLKLYQPAHQRFYLVSASLVCGVTGLPDRAMVAGGAEQVNFVIRRLLPQSAGSTGVSDVREFAFIKDATGATWRRVTDDEDAFKLAPGEELLPLFPLGYRDPLDHARTLWTGLVPVGRREEYIAANVDRTVIELSQGQIQSLLPGASAAPQNGKTARMTQFKLEVAEPWKTLIRASYAASDSVLGNPPQVPTGDALDNARRRAVALNLQWQMQSWLVLLDFADYLATYLPAVWNAIDTGAANSDPASDAGAILTFLDSATISGDLDKAMAPDPSHTKPSASSLRDALKKIRDPAVRALIEQADKLYDPTTFSDPDWPAFHYLLAGITKDDTATNAFKPDGAFKALDSLIAPSGVAVDADANPPEPTPPKPSNAFDVARKAADKIDKLTAVITRALDDRPETDVPAVPFALQLRDALSKNNGDPGLFVLRLVYFNRECGPLHVPTLSAPTQRFQLANFFDPDAPARPIRVTLPVDTTPAGLRKHSKNTAFVISDVLCGQIQRAKGLGLVDLVRAVLPWPLHKDLDVGGGGACKNGGGANIGMICSLSIPIITICALILLMIIVSLLDLIFRWIPWFIVCFPLPGLKGKK